MKIINKKDIIFVINPSIWYQNMYPSGILCLSGYLKNKGFDNIILDSKISSKKISLEKREKAIINTIKKNSPKVVCFSSSHKEYDEVIRMNHQIKKYNKKIFTIVGGSQPTYRGEDYLNNGFDFIGIGEGENTLFEFIREIYDESFQWGKINGLGWRYKNKIRINPDRELMNEKNINDIEIPPYEKIDSRYFDMNVGTIRGLPLKGALLLTTRGCPFSCVYCGCNLIFGRKLRFKSLQNIEKEVRYLKDKYSIEGIWIVDDTFTINEKHIIGVSKILKKYDVIWGCQSRVDVMNEKLIKIMKQNGCVQIDFGVESGSQRILDDIIGKKIKTEQVIRAFSLTKKYGIRSLANFMIGLPTETYADLKKTEKLADSINADVYLFQIATPLPGTRLYDIVNEYISPHEYSLLNWNGSTITEKLNKSKIKDLVFEKKRLHNKYFYKTLSKSIFSLHNYLFFITRKYKYERIKYIATWFIKYLTSAFWPNISQKYLSNNPGK